MTSKPDRRSFDVIIVHEHRLIREGLRSLLEQGTNLNVVADVPGGWEAVDECRRLDPELVILPVSMSGLNAFETVRHLIEEHPRVRVVGLAKAGEERLAGQLRRAGAHAYALLEGDRDSLVLVINRVLGLQVASGGTPGAPDGCQHQG